MSKNLTKKEIEKFSRQIILKDIGTLGQKKILESRRGVYALCLNENDLNNVKLKYFYNIFEYKKHGSFINGECNYVVDALVM